MYISRKTLTDFNEMCIGVIIKNFNYTKNAIRHLLHNFRQACFLYCLFGVNPSFMFVLNIEASKPTMIDLKSDPCHRNDLYVYGLALTCPSKTKTKVKLSTQSAEI